MSLYFTGRRTALVGEFRNHTREEYEFVIRRLGGVVDPQITPETDNVLVGWYFSDQDYQALEMNAPRKILMLEAKFEDFLQDFDSADMCLVENLMYGAYPPDVVGKFR